MSGNAYVILAYAIGLALLWGYAAILWLSPKASCSKEKE